MSDRKRRAISGILAGTGGAVIVQFTTLLVTPLYLDLTSQELFGLWLTLGAILGWIKIGDMGLGMALTRRSVEAFENDDYALLCRLAYGAILPAFIFSIVVTGVGYLFTDTLVTIFGIDSILEAEFRRTYNILLGIAAVRPALGVFSSLIDGKQHIAYISIRNTALSLITIVVTLSCLFLDYGIVSFAYGLLSEALIIAFVDITYLKIIDKKVIFFPIKTSKKEVLSLLSFGGPFQILKLTNLVSTNVDNIIIASIIGASSVSIYVFTGKLAFLFAIFLVTIVPSMLFPGIAQLFELRDTKKIANVYMKLSNLAIRLGLLTSVVYYSINELFVNLWVGSENYGGSALSAIFVIWVIFESFIRGVTVIIYASGKLGRLAVISCIEACLNIILTLYLINSIGLYGAVLGTVLSRLISMFYIPIQVNRTLQIPNFKYLVGLMRGAIIYSMPMIIIVSTMNSLMDNASTSIIQSVVIVCAALLLNILSFEGVFLMKQRGVRWRDRLQLLGKNYYSV